MEEAERQAIAAAQVAEAALQHATAAREAFWDGEEARYARYCARASREEERAAETYATAMQLAEENWRREFLESTEA
eukprot:9645-Alexandrium_andersonii.AAC.1